MLRAELKCLKLPPTPPHLSQEFPHCKSWFAFEWVSQVWDRSDVYELKCWNMCQSHPTFSQPLLLWIVQMVWDGLLMQVIKWLWNSPILHPVVRIISLLFLFAVNIESERAQSCELKCFKFPQLHSTFSDKFTTCADSWSVFKGASQIWRRVFRWFEWCKRLLGENWKFWAHGILLFKSPEGI